MRPFILLMIFGMGLAACSAKTPPVATEEPFYAPDFTLSALDGVSYTLKDLRGKWVLINFWATWCQPCIAEMPLLQEISTTYPNQLQVLGINMRETPTEIQPFIVELGISYPILLNPDDATLANYQVVGLPQTILIDPNGELQWRQVGELTSDNFPGQLEKFLNPH